MTSSSFIKPTSTTLSGDHLVFPNFDDIAVSTKTFIAQTNLLLDLNKLFDILTVSDYTVVPKKRGRKKKLDVTNPNTNVINGSIITLKYENKIKGVDLKQKKSNLKKKKSKWFRNSFTVVMILDEKPVNFKICKNGMFQITGVKFDHQAENCVKIIWDQIKSYKDGLYNFCTKNGCSDKLVATIIPAMRNIDFSLGFLVDREKLARYMSTQTEFHSLLETSFGYTGVNIKIPVTQNITEIKLKKITSIDSDSSEFDEEFITYEEYLKGLSEKEQQKRLQKKRFTTFLIFHSGRTIASSLTADTTKDAYNYFLKIIRTCFDQIEERLDK